MINVSNIERFATHDGPGIRTTIFLKGCPLHCPWCANPETWYTEPVIMHHQNKCVGCKRCAQACKQKAISFIPDFHLDYDLCNSCSRCSEVCLNDALSLSGKSMSIEEIMETVRKDNDYYRNSGGGITISGGEPFMQSDVTIELLKALKEEGYHTSVETAGNYSCRLLQKAIEYVDLFLFDFKHTDEEIFRNTVGGDLKTVMNNLEYLSRICPDKVIIRVPVIYGFNYDEDTITRIIQKAADFNFKEVDLLPFHNLGRNKWEALQKKWAYGQQKMMSKEQLQQFVGRLKLPEIRIKIGG